MHLREGFYSGCRAHRVSVLAEADTQLSASSQLLIETALLPRERWRLDRNLRESVRDCGIGFSSYQIEIAIPSPRRVNVLPVIASGPRSFKPLKATLVLWTLTFDFASQSLTCLSTVALRMPVKVLTFIAQPQKGAPEWSKPRRVCHF